MRSRALFWLFLAAALYAQPIRDEEIVDRLDADLLPLRSLASTPNQEALADLLAITPQARASLQATLEARNPEQSEIMSRFADDAAKFYGVTVIPWDLAYAITSVLSGKELTDDKLAPLTRSIIEALDSAFVCRQTRSDLRRSAAFRASAERAYRALRALDVSVANAEVVAGEMLKTGDSIASRVELLLKRLGVE